jgi:hypothetical protein
MIAKRNGSLGGLGMVVVLALCGCAKTPPSVTDATGTLTLDNKPLPQAWVEFVPQLKDFGAEMNSSAITDDQGHFTLTCAFNSEPGAVVAKHRVLVREAPTPGEFRRQDEQTQARYKQYRDKLKNRPIPTSYGNLEQTPLVIEVKPDQKTYDLKLTR